METRERPLHQEGSTYCMIVPKFEEQKSLKEKKESDLVRNKILFNI